jgi:hypothetical protein
MREPWNFQPAKERPQTEMRVQGVPVSFSISYLKLNALPRCDMCALNTKRRTLDQIERQLRTVTSTNSCEQTATQEVVDIQPNDYADKDSRICKFFVLISTISHNRISRSAQKAKSK